MKNTTKSMEAVLFTFSCSLSVVITYTTFIKCTLMSEHRVDRVIDLGKTMCFMHYLVCGFIAPPK